MNVLWRYVGGGLVLLSAMIASAEYRSYAKRRILQYEGLIALLAHIEGMIGRYLASGDGLYRGFESAELERIGLLPLLRQGVGLADAFKRCLGEINLPKDSRKAVSEFLSGLGRDYKEGELKSLREFRTELEREKSTEAERLEKNAKVITVLLIGGALAFLIMII